MTDTYTVPGFGPSDLLTSPVEGERRVKVEAVVRNEDPGGNRARATLTQENLTATRNDAINVQFQYNVPVNVDAGDVVGAATGTGTLSHSNGMAVVDSGAAVGSYRLESRDSIRYFPGHEFAAEMTAFASVTGAAGYSVEWGVGDAQDAAAFAYRNGVFGVLFRSAGVDEFIPSSQWNGEPLTGISPLLLNLWTIRGGWYGILPIQFGVYAGKARGYITLHTLDLTNSRTRPHLSNPTLPMFARAVRTSGAGSVKVSTASWRGGICGDTPKRTKADRTFNVSVVDKTITGGASPKPVVTLRNNSTFQGKVNHVRVRYGTIALSTDGTKDVVWEVFKGGALTGAVFVPKNPTCSVIDYDISATAFTPAGDNIGGTVMGKVAQTRINLFEGDVVLAVYPGETITLTARSSNNSTVGLFFRWIEEF